MAVTAGLAIAMSAGMVAPATVAFAAPSYGQGSITINKADDNFTQSFNGYQIFKANVTDDSAEGNTTGKKEANVEWANDSVKKAVEGVIKQKDTKYAGTTAQDAADWIVNNVTGTTNTTQVAGNSVAHQLAEALKGTSTPVKLNPGEAKTIDEGYWLFVKDPDSTLATGETGTAPIFAVVGGSAVNVTEKVSKDTIPTPDKTLKNKDTATGDTDRGGSVAVGDTVTYELSATIPSSIATYKTYKLEFSDTLSDGLTYTKDSVKNAQLVGADGTKKKDLKLPTVSGEGQTHTFTYSDIKPLLGSDYTYAAGDKIVFDYDATVNQNAATGKDLSNRVQLTYSNDPNDPNGTGTTDTTPTVHEYTYKLVLNKVDLGTEAALDGAKFTVQNKTTKKYIKADGSQSDAAVELTAANGTLTLTGLDAGTYTVTETSAPNPYDKAASFDVKIAPTFKTDGTIDTLGNNLTTRDDLIAGTIDTNSTKGDNVLQAAANTASDANKGTVTVTVGDKKEITMPLTGMKGTTALVVYGSAILVVSAAAYLKHKKSQSQANAD